MKLIVLGLAIVAASAPKIAAAEAPQPMLQLKPKSAIAPTVVPNPIYAPFVAPIAADLDFMPRRDLRDEQSRSSCNGERDLCYDPSSGRIVYKPARSFMPELPGLQRENISVKRDRLVFRYSF